ncbi:MAG: glycerophosphodiester phosphodiesterase family protein [Peptostreptococcaceae bacterium]
MKKSRKIILVVIVLLIVGIWLNNTCIFVKSENSSPKLLAHRGLAQTFDLDNVEWDTNTAEIIHEPEHEYLENTIPSMEVAFSNGADLVELDIKLTKDNQLAVFHDYLLEYRTNGTGEIENFTMEELKKLDVGYGYTADGGKTYPFRGKGIGMMPTIEEVFEAFPDKELLIHVKSNDEEIGKVLLSYLEEMDKNRLSQITVYGDNLPIQYLKDQNENIRAMSKKTMKEALISYELLGWTGYIPEELKNTYIALPVKYAKFLWGWPNKFVERMDKANTKVVIVEGNGKWSEGFDDKKSLENVPKGYSGYIWTNRIDKISKEIKNID